MTRTRTRTTTGAARALLFTLGLSLGACAQPPTVELQMAQNRVAKAAGAGAALFAPELLAEAEGSLGEANRLVESEGRYRAAVRAAAHACLRADEAFTEATTERRIVEVRLGRLETDIEGLLEMARYRGAEDRAASELEALTGRLAKLRATKEQNLLEAFELARVLKPEALAFEQRFRPVDRQP